jgi:hypothetical protein
MENKEMKDFVQSTAMLWQEHKKREKLYLRMMKKDNLGSLRRLCYQGHLSALLFQKEIQWIYEYFKCNLNDGEVSNGQSETKYEPSSLDLVEDKGVLVRVLKETECATIKCYQSLLQFVERDDEIYPILHEHLDRLHDFCDKLSREISTVTQREKGRLTYA